MPRAIRGTHNPPSALASAQRTHIRALPGVLVEADPSIKSIIVNIDSRDHEYIIEDLDHQRVVVKENMLPELKRKLNDVWKCITRSANCLRDATG